MEGLPHRWVAIFKFLDNAGVNAFDIAWGFFLHF
jgi:hypothetical protein